MQLSTIILCAILAITNAIAAPTPKISGPTTPKHPMKPQHHYISTPAYNDRATAYLTARSPKPYRQNTGGSHVVGGKQGRRSKKREVEETLETRDFE